VNVVRHEVSFLDPTLSLFGKLPQNLTQVSPYLAEDLLFPILRDEYDVILTVPPRVA